MELSKKRGKLRRNTGDIDSIGRIKDRNKREKINQNWNERERERCVLRRREYDREKSTIHIKRRHAYRFARDNAPRVYDKGRTPFLNVNRPIIMCQITIPKKSTLSLVRKVT